MMMKGRRSFVKSVSMAAASAVGASAVARAQDGGNGGPDFLGGWTTVHASPVGPFRELLMFAAGGGLTETNSLLHTSSNITFLSQFGLPAVVNASDGIGTWERVTGHEIRVSFRKLLFDGNRVYFGDFWVKGTLRFNSDQITADWTQIWIVNPDNQLLLDLGPATSTGTRIR
jgi:hypothetical protein